MSAIAAIQKSQAASAAAVSTMALARQPVSTWSNFSDLSWILSPLCTIHWSRFSGDYATVNRRDFDCLMRPLRLLAYLLLTEEELRPRTVLTVIWGLKDFAAWLLTLPVPVTRFREVTSSTLNIDL